MNKILMKSSPLIADDLLKKINANLGDIEGETNTKHLLEFKSGTKAKIKKSETQ